jgi:hypothetical protein
MATGTGPKPSLYIDDNNKKFYYPMHKYLLDAQAGGGAAGALDGSEGKWPYKRGWMRHVDVLFSDGTRDTIPIMTISNTLYKTGGSITVVFPSGSKTGVVTGRRGEKVHIAHN